MKKTITKFLKRWVQYKCMNCNFSTLLKPKLIISLLLFSCSNIFGQGLKQTTEQWPKGEPLKVEYLNDDLKIIKQEFYDPDGVKVASYSIDPETQKFHGEFYDGTNKGSYNQGILTAQNFRIIDASSRSDDVEIIINVKDGILQGQAVKNVYYSNPPFTARLRNNGYVGNDRVYIRFEKFINKKYQERLKERNIKDKQFLSKKYILKFDENGLLHGPHVIDRFHTMYFDHGECTGILTYDGNAGYNDFDDNDNFIGVNGYALDSVFRDQKIWKRNYKLIKNIGFVEGFMLPNIYNVDKLRLLSLNAYDYDGVHENKIFTGQEVFEGYNNLRLFNSEVSVIPESINSIIHPDIHPYQNQRFHIDFLFEFRTASLDKYGFYVNDLSPILSVFKTQHWSNSNIFNYHVDTIGHFKVIFALQNLHCWINTDGLNDFKNINFYIKPIEQFKDKSDNKIMIACHGCAHTYNAERFPESFWMDNSLGEKRECNIYNSTGSFNKTSFALLNELRKNIGTHKSNELSVNFFFIKKDLTKEFKNRDEIEKIGLYSFDEVIDFSAIQEKNKEISENFEKEKKATKLKIEEVCLKLTSGIESENWDVLIDLSKELDRQIALNEKMGYDLSIEDPRTAFLKGSKKSFVAYVNEQIEKQKIRAEYKELKEGLEQIASKLNLKFETNIPTDGDLMELNERLSIKNKSLSQFLNDIERRLNKMKTSVKENFDDTDEIAFKAIFSDEQKDAGPLHFVLYFDVGKPKNDFLKDKKSLRQEWKSNSPKLIFQFSTENISTIFYLYGNIRFAFQYNQL